MDCLFYDTKRQLPFVFAIAVRESIKEFSDLSEAPCGIVGFIDEDANQIDSVFLKVRPI